MHTGPDCDYQYVAQSTNCTVSGELYLTQWPFGDWCNSKHFNNLQIIFDLNYCGWASYDPTWNSQCKDSNIAKGQTCEQFVMNNPEYFKDAYWLINDLSVYELQ